MSKTAQSRLSPEVTALQTLLESARQASPQLWDSVAAAVNATDVTVVTSFTADESPKTQIISAGETTTASRLEGYHG